MHAGRRVTVGICLVVVVAMAVVPGAATQPGPTGPSAGVFQQEFDADSVLLQIHVLENGSARWTVRYRLALETQNETAAFEELQSDIEQNRSAFLSGFRSRMQETVAAAENATGREMAATGFSVSTSRQPVTESGFVTYSFMWLNFAAVEGSTLRIGDAISGLFLDRQTTLTIGWPTEYEVTRVDPDPDQQSENAVSWEGRRSFGADEPRVVVEPAGFDLADILPYVLGGLLVIVVVVGVVLVYRDRRDEPIGVSIPDSLTGGGTVAGGDGDGEVPPSELLSNEERVIQLLEAHGGRMKQQEVVAELEWTEAKTSQVVNGMQDDGSLEVFRIGRENVLKLPEEDTDEEESSS